MKAVFLLLVLALIAAACLSGCVPGDGKATPEKPAGFLWGIWHGWVAPISLVVGIFNHDVRVYEPYNTGWWYDFGFYMAVISGFGGLSLVRRRR
jgi:hypothetical protein